MAVIPRRPQDAIFLSSNRVLPEGVSPCGADGRFQALAELVLWVAPERSLQRTLPCHQSGASRLLRRVRWQLVEQGHQRAGRSKGTTRPPRLPAWAL